jgi:Domain of unknown function (DUF4868)
MTKEQALIECKDFSVAGAAVSLWIFKKRTGGSFSAQSIDITDALTTEIKSIVSNALGGCTEVEDYSLLTQTNDVSALHVGKDETSFADLQALLDRPAEEHRYQTARDLKGVAGYVIRLRDGGRVLYCVRRVPDAWQTRKARTVVNVVLRANQLDLADDPSFTIARTLDFVVFGDDILVFDKRSFEGLLNYKLEYASSFAQLQQENLFVGRFASMQPLIDHVGTNTMHLRRMAVVKQKAHYADAAYMDRLRQVNQQQGWNIQFDPTGRIVATEDTMKVIMQVLLDHRLYSQLSLATFDVPSTSAV